MLRLIPGHLGYGLIIIEVALTITVILTALYAPTKFSDRAFRMLPWTNREPGLRGPAEDRRQQMEAATSNWVAGTGAVTDSHRESAAPLS